MLTTLESIKQLTELKYGDLINSHLYDIADLNLKIDSPSGYIPIKSFIIKPGNRTTVEFETGETIVCSSSHKFMTDTGKKVAAELAIGDSVKSKSNSTVIAKIDITDNEELFYDIEVDDEYHVFYTANDILHHNTGKTFTIEQELKAAGKSDGDGYFKITGTASAIGIYKMLYQHRNDIILVDDCDDAFLSQEARNIFKAATDTKKIRKIAWMKKAGKDFYNPDTDDVPEDDEDGEDAMVPTYFDFKGRIIAVTNLNLDSLDKDGAFRTRSFLVNIDPTDVELVDFMSKLAPSIELEDGLQMSVTDRVDTAMFLRTLKAKSNLSLRTLCRALNIRASGIENWKNIVSRYA